MNRFEGENFEVGYMTNNSPWVNPSDFLDEDLMHLAVIPQGHFWTEAPFGYSGQNLEILDTTANESINVQNILIEEMHDSILQKKKFFARPLAKIRK